MTSLSNIMLFSQKISCIFCLKFRFVKKGIKNNNQTELSKSLLRKLEKISKRLGGTNFKIVDNLIRCAFEKDDKEIHFEWIKQLLVNYYDKMYSYQLNQKKDRCIKSGDWAEVKQYILSST
jgi:tRNA 2-selenouridine synthase